MKKYVRENSPEPTGSNKKKVSMQTQVRERARQAEAL